MNRNKNFEKDLPENYVLVKHVDAKTDKKQAALYTLFSLVPVLVLLPVLYIIARFGSGYDIFEKWYDDNGLIALCIACGVLFVSIILHELTHGIVYKIATGGKLAFGLTLTVAFCGVPDLYVRKNASVAALVMPFCVFGAIFTAVTVWLFFVSPLYGILSGAVLAVHLGGCVGDLHWTLLYLTKFKHCDTLMRDTGPEQWLYVRQDEAERCGIVPVISDEKSDYDSSTKEA